MEAQPTDWVESPMPPKPMERWRRAEDERPPPRSGRGWSQGPSRDRPLRKSRAPRRGPGHGWAQAWPGAHPRRDLWELGERRSLGGGGFPAGCKPGGGACLGPTASFAGRCPPWPRPRRTRSRASARTRWTRNNQPTGPRGKPRGSRPGIVTFGRCRLPRSAPGRRPRPRRTWMKACAGGEVNAGAAARSNAAHAMKVGFGGPPSEPLWSGLKMASGTATVLPSTASTVPAGVSQALRGNGPARRSGVGHSQADGPRRARRRGRSSRSAGVRGMMRTAPSSVFPCPRRSWICPAILASLSRSCRRALHPPTGQARVRSWRAW